jgi:predicted small secreted protein
VAKFLLVVIASSLIVSGCATVKGLGRDIESVGKAGQGAIDGAKKR